MSFLSDVQSRGASAALRTLNLDRLAGRPLAEVFLGLADHICPDAGTVDAGIAREAFIETIVDLSAMGVTDLDALSTEQMNTVFELYATHAIEARLYNDIGTKVITAPTNAREALTIQTQVREFIRNSVSDALTTAREENPNLTQERIAGFVEWVYERAFGLLQALGNAEADA